MSEVAQGRADPPTVFETEIVERLKDTIDAAEEYRERFVAESPTGVSLVDASYEGKVEDVWRRYLTGRRLRSVRRC